MGKAGRGLAKVHKKYTALKPNENIGYLLFVLACGVAVFLWLSFWRDKPVPTPLVSANPTSLAPAEQGNVANDSTQGGR